MHGMRSGPCERVRLDVPVAPVALARSLARELTCEYAHVRRAKRTCARVRDIAQRCIAWAMRVQP
eukprot:1095367-Alexandrium_andersonii.AAC.1